MTLTFAEQHEVFKNNVTTGMLEHFAEEQWYQIQQKTLESVAKF